MNVSTEKQIEKKWTEEEITKEIEESNIIIRSSLKEVSKYLVSNDFLNPQFPKLVFLISAQYFKLRGTNYACRNRLRRSTAATIMEERGVPLIVKLVTKLVDLYLPGRFTDENGKHCNKRFAPLRSLMGVPFNYSDASEEFAKAMCQEDGYIEILIRFQIELRHEFMQGKLHSEVEKLLRISISTPYNFMIHGSTENVNRIHDYNMMETVKPYMNSKDDHFKITVLLFFAYAATEEQAELLLTQNSSIDYLIKLLEMAVNDPYKRGKGYSSIELALGLEHLAKNDTNKHQLVEQGVVPVLKTMTHSTMAKEREVSFLTIWTLAFDATNRPKFQKELKSEIQTPCLPESCKKEDDETPEMFAESIFKVEKARLGALWVIEQDSDDVSPARRVSAKGVSRSNSQPAGHVMISYNHKNTQIANRINQELQNKQFSTWIDSQHMKGNTLDAMATAVETASAMLVFMSSTYKSSQNCRSEAEYAYRLGKPIIPIVVEPKYRPDGWLGLMIGTKLYYDFSGKYPFEEKLPSLIQCLRDQLMSGDLNFLDTTSQQIQEQDFVKQTSCEPSFLHLGSATSTNVTNPDYVNWTSDQVKDWSLKNGFTRFPKISITGRHLHFLKQLKHEAPEAFYRKLENQFKMCDLDQTIDFLEILAKLN